MSLQKPAPTAASAAGKTFPPITKYDVTGVSRKSIAADLDGTLLIASSAFPYFMLVAIEAGSLLRGLCLLLCFPLIAVAYIFISESLAIEMLIFISFAGLKIRDIELAARAVLPRFYAADVRRESYEVFEKCKRKVVVTANPTIMVEPFVREFLGGVKVLGTEIEVNPKTKRATGFVKRPGVLVGKWKRLAVMKEFGDESPDIGIGDRESDHDFMSICKKLPVRFAMDRAGLVGADGPTHSGSFDVTYMACLPNMVVMAPSDEAELFHMVATAAAIDDRPSCFRYPRGNGLGVQLPPGNKGIPLEVGKGRILIEGDRVALLGYGAAVQSCLAAAALVEPHGLRLTVADARFCKPLDHALIRSLAKSHEILITVEEGSIGGFGSHVAQFMALDGLLDGKIKLGTDGLFGQENVVTWCQEWSKHVHPLQLLVAMHIQT